jgi:hypothetical protein
MDSFVLAIYTGDSEVEELKIVIPPDKNTNLHTGTAVEEAVENFNR